MLESSSELVYDYGCKLFGLSVCRNAFCKILGYVSV